MEEVQQRPIKFQPIKSPEIAISQSAVVEESVKIGNSHPFSLDFQFSFKILGDAGFKSDGSNRRRWDMGNCFTRIRIQ